MRLDEIKETMITLVGTGREHLNGDWFGVSEDDLDLIEQQAKEIIIDYFNIWAKREALIDDDDDNNDDDFDPDDVTVEVIEEEVVEEENKERNRKGTITFTGENIDPNINYIIHTDEMKPYITEDELKRDYEFEKTSGEGHQLTDDYHTMSELYFHRMILFVTVLRLAKEKGYKLYKSKLHHDGSKIDGYFIVGIETPEGQYAYHYNMKYWEYFNFVNEWERAPKWDGSKANDLHRLLSL